MTEQNNSRREGAEKQRLEKKDLFSFVLDCTLSRHFVILLHSLLQIPLFIKSNFLNFVLFNWAMNLGPGNKSNTQSLQSVTERSILKYLLICMYRDLIQQVQAWKKSLTLNYLGFI